MATIPPAPPAAVDNDFETARDAICDIPAPVGDLESLRTIFNSSIKMVAKRAPVTAMEMASLFDTHSPYTNCKLHSVLAAYEHLQIERSATEEKRKRGRPVKVELVEQAEQRAAQKLVRQQKRAKRDAATAVYRAKLDRYAQRRDHLAAMRMQVEEAKINRTQAVIAAEKELRAFKQEWQAYIDSLAANYREVKALPADEWVCDD